MIVLFSMIVRGQKINSCRYKNVDSVVKYYNAETITYKNRSGKPVTDTVYFSDMKCNINIDSATSETIFSSKKLLRRKIYTRRYFEIMYFGKDTIGNIKYGSYFLFTNGNYFPTKNEIDSILITDYRLPFRKNDTYLSFIISEFKNEKEYSLLNHE